MFNYVFGLALFLTGLWLLHGLQWLFLPATSHEFLALVLLLVGGSYNGRGAEQICLYLKEQYNASRSVKGS